MNKKGFTLVELLAVIALLAILMGIAVPNIISTINNNKRNTFLADAKRMISKAEYLISSNRDDRNKLLNNEVSYITYYLNESGLNEKQEYTTDADGGPYSDKTFVKVSLKEGSYEYCVCVVGSRRNISTNGNCNSLDNCLTSDRLTGIDVVKDN